MKSFVVLLAAPGVASTVWIAGLHIADQLTPPLALVGLGVPLLIAGASMLVVEASFRPPRWSRRVQRPAPAAIQESAR
jgi:hypothetical protein